MRLGELSLFSSAEVMLAFCVGIFLADLVCGRLWLWDLFLVSACQKPMLSSEGCKLKRGGDIPM